MHASDDDCLLYALHEGPDGRLVMIEKYSSMEALDAHGKSAELAELVAALDGKLAEKMDVQVLAPHSAGSAEGRALTRLARLRPGAFRKAVKVSEEAMANKWFETVAVAQRRAKKRLPKSVYGALIAGAEAGVTDPRQRGRVRRARARPARRRAARHAGRWRPR